MIRTVVTTPENRERAEKVIRASERSKIEQFKSAPPGTTGPQFNKRRTWR